MSDSQRLGKRVRKRRYRLRLTQAMLARRSGLSEKQIGIVERGERDNYAPATLVALDEALEWEPGTAADTLDGGDPVEADEPPESPASVEERLAALEDWGTALEERLAALEDRGTG